MAISRWSWRSVVAIRSTRMRRSPASCAASGVTSAAYLTRTADGKPNLTAPVPRTPEGKPDLSGIWQPEINPYRFDLIQDLKDEAIFRPAAKAILMERVKDFHRDDPVTNCLPTGPSEILNAMYRIIQTPTLVVLLYESGTGRYRQIYMDGRKLPKDPNPTWLGYSVGRWEGDTLVVESAGC